MQKALLGFHQLAGDVAVQCFYMISGFYMALVLTRKYNRPSDYFVFIEQRILRIFPTYFIILLLFMGVEAAFPNGSSFNCWDAWKHYGSQLSFGTKALLGLTNFTVIGQDWLLFFAVDPSGHLYFTPDFTLQRVPSYLFYFCRPAWSLGLELTFYAMAPLLLRQKVGWQIAVLLASVALRLILQTVYHLGHDPWTYRFFPSQLAFFMAGAIGYKLYAENGPLLLKFMANKKWMVGFFWLAIFTYSRLPGSSGIRSLCFIGVAAIMIPLLFAAFGACQWDRVIGELSYPLYLLHMLALYLFDPIRNSPFYSPLCLLTGIGSAALFYWLIESRLEHYRENLFRRQRRPAKT